MSKTESPTLSIILLMSRSFDWLQKTLVYWGRQTIHDQIEAIIVRPEHLRDVPIKEEFLRPFHSYRVITILELSAVGVGFAAGVHEAAGEYVALAEDHAFPQPDVAEKLVAAFRSDPAVVAAGPKIDSANMRSSISQASFINGFWMVMFEQKSRAVSALAGHNTSYRRDFLTGYGDELATVYEVERILHFEIEKQGKTLYIVADATMHHANISRLSMALVHDYWGGRWFGAKRAEDWSVGRKLVYIIGAPLIPLVRLRRIVAAMRQSPDDYRELPKLLPALLLMLAAHAFGEGSGYLLGSGKSSERYAPFELSRREQLSDADRAVIDQID
ncbi:MAG: glycosyltransferase [Burkholderiales bacterium]|nr:glycosyltransferase [Anaerolineae bacterium]